LSGANGNGQRYDQLVYTLDISASGVRIAGITCSLKVGDTVTLRHHQDRGKYRVMWTRKMPATDEWQAGLQHLDNKTHLWRS
jgi:hypothetical protein